VLETPSADPHWRQLYRALAAITIAQALGIVLCASLIFFALPRLAGGYLGDLAQQTDLMSGFGERVQLGQIGRIQQSSQVVMHVRFDGTAPSEIRLRGASLANFDGQNWSSSPHGVAPVVTISQAFFRPAEPGGLRSFASGHTARLVQYRVILEPIGTNVVFVVPTPRALFGNTRQVLESFDESIETLDPDRFLSSYSGVSDIAQPSRADLMEASGAVPRGMPARYLQLPERLDARIAPLAAEVTRGHTTAYDKAETIERYLSSNFAYTLELPRQPQRDPIANFLFERKRGHCEYFASAMAVMLREQGVASRVVTGFRGGEFNELTGSYIIRARDAHAWVEAYIPGKGWATFDPTPASGEIPGRWSKLQLYLDAANEFWRDWVVNYDYAHQRILTASTMTHSRRASEKAWAMFTGVYPRLIGWARALSRSVSLHPRRYQAMGMAVIGLALCIPLSMQTARWMRRSALLAQPGRDPKHAATLLYEQMTRATGSRGWRRKPSQTPSEFASAISHTELHAAVARFTLHYERARYADSAEDAALLPGLLQQVKSAAR
jgi:transglutaminase-like putative cysteine protease